MPDPLIRYDLLAQQALRGVVRTVLADVAKNGLPGEHHFKITFNTTAPGVRLSDRLRAQYPESMTIILRAQFWDLAVEEHAFEVGLSFGGIGERLAVPFDSIVAFYDPAVQFGFQFEAVDAAAADQSEAAKAPAGEDKSAQQPSVAPAGKRAAGTKAEPASGKTAEAATDGDDKPDGDKPDSGGEVVRLDRFRKK